ncbi:glycoside hydrolase family 27 protein [Mucilaginibacter polytrichastri]|uniref:Alpha-galactosidase n=1 Tax=Mucilaginibacter polytrichastri TaxID=1302689 RepID=A0A1Q5ZTP7_9SPHI|nr:glycoside hydrolase family 27 protein [Mucilaginibacter polytrichastri]OKS85103.1 Alpha-galactosidase A [Mucilaginibacter polytrichastri]SFS44481.1 alpha-galactosidase [Mucilaginibacter polytrichastri]
MKFNQLKNLVLICITSLITVNITVAQDAAAPVKVTRQADADNSHLALTPPMGFNTWNTFQTNINEQMLKEMVDTYVSSGMRDAGYQYFVLDDGWMTMDRDAKGDLVADPKKFPNGMKAFADYVHLKGLKFGIYNCAGDRTCAGYPGTRGHEYQDARLYASWDVDYLKYDWCNTDSLNAREAYITMSKALKATGRPIVFSLCEWGNHQPWLWGKGVGQLWRSTGDICNQFDKDKNVGTWTALSVMTILDKQDKIRQYAGPGHWNDPDMLEVGNGMSVSEDRAHFSLWCMLAAPLMAGNDLRKMSPQTHEILTNKEAIAVDQDSLGIQGFRYYAFDGLEMWVKPLNKQDVAVCFLNRSAHPQNIDYAWEEHLLQDTISHLNINFAQETYKVRDLWVKKDLGTTKKLFKQVIAPHDVVMLRLRKAN